MGTCVNYSLRSNLKIDLVKRYTCIVNFTAKNKMSSVQYKARVIVVVIIW